MYKRRSYNGVSTFLIVKYECVQIIVVTSHRGHHISVHNHTLNNKSYWCTSKVCCVQVTGEWDYESCYP